MRHCAIFIALGGLLAVAAGCSGGSQTADAPAAQAATTLTTETAAITFSPSPSPTPLPTAPPTPSPTPIPIHHAPPYTVVLDPGHGGPYYFGATGSDAQGRPLIEKELNLDIALRLAQLLRDAGYNAVLTRDGDYTLTAFDPARYRQSLSQETQARVDLANSATADILAGIHLNGSVDGSQSGTEVYCNPDRSFGAESCMLGAYVQAGLLRSLHDAGYESRDRGEKNDYEVGGPPEQPHSFLLGINETERPSLMPGIMAEALFLSNPNEADLLSHDETRQAIAAGYKIGIDAYFVWLNGGG